MTASVDNVLASLAVRELAAAGRWYAQLLGLDGTSPMPELREWSFARGGGLQIHEDRERAGGGSCTLAVGSIEAIVARLETMGVDTRKRTSSDRVDTVMVSDPDGNHLAFAHAKDAALAR